MTNRIKELRERQSLSQAELADLINDAFGENTNSSTISKLENGKIKLVSPWMEHLAAALEVEPYELIYDPSAGGETAPVLADDVVPYASAAGDHLSSLRGPSRELWLVKSDALSELGIRPGDAILVDTSDTIREQIQTNDTVLVELEQDRKTTLHLVRQFIEPNLLITNSQFFNQPSFNLRVTTAQIKGLILNHIRRTRRGK